MVAHGLGMSVNGQDPRSNVYLLDGTLQNDFTNGPAGSAAGTALGMETVREFRVETNAYSAEFGRNSGGQINVLTKSGSQQLRRQPLRVPPQRRARRPQLFRRRRASRTSTATSSAARSADRSQRDRTFFFLGYEALIERLGKTISTVVPDDNARHRHPAERRGRRQPGGRAVPRRVSRAPTARSLGQGLASLQRSPSIRRSTSTSRRAASTTTSAPSTQLFARYTFDDTDQFLPTDYPQFPRDFISRNQFFTGRVPPRPVAEHAEHHAASASAGRASARTSRPTRRSRCRPFVPARATAWATSTSAACTASVRRAPATSGWCRTCSACRTTWCTRAAGTCSRPAALAEHYQDNMVNPTFSLGIYHVRRPERVPRATCRPASSA